MARLFLQLLVLLRLVQMKSQFSHTNGMISYIAYNNSSTNWIYLYNLTRIAETFSREKKVLGELLVAYLAVRLANAVIPTWKKPASVECNQRVDNYQALGNIQDCMYYW